jgi:hypothetical protein
MKRDHGYLVSTDMMTPVAEESEITVPLNETDKGWVKNAIEEAFKQRSQKWKDNLRTWSLPSISVAILIFFATQWGLLYRVSHSH